MKWICSFSIILLLNGTGTAQICSSNYSCFYSGDIVSLSCVLYNDSYTFQHWVNPSNEYFNATNGRFTITEITNYHYTPKPLVILTVLNLTTADNGIYSCFVRYNGAIFKSDSVNITVVDPVIIYSTSVNVTVSVGESLTFSCNATNFLRRQWIYMINSTHSHVLSNTSNGRVTITSDYDVQIINVSLEDEGTYQCLLCNCKGNVSVFNTLTVSDTPTFNKSQYVEFEIYNSTVPVKNVNTVNINGNRTSKGTNEVRKTYIVTSILSVAILFLASALLVVMFKYLKLRKRMKSSNKEIHRFTGRERKKLSLCCLPFMRFDRLALPAEEPSSSLPSTTAAEYEEIQLPKKVRGSQSKTGNEAMNMTECVAYGHL